MRAESAAPGGAFGAVTLDLLGDQGVGAQRPGDGVRVGRPAGPAGWGAYCEVVGGELGQGLLGGPGRQQRGRRQVPAALRLAVEVLVHERGRGAQDPEARQQRLDPARPPRPGPGRFAVRGRDPQHVQVPGQPPAGHQQRDQRIVGVPELPQRRGDGAAGQPGGDRQAPDPERQVRPAGLLPGVTERPQHQPGAGALPAGVPVPLSQPQRRPPRPHQPIAVGRQAPRQHLRARNHPQDQLRGGHSQ